MNAITANPHITHAAALVGRVLLAIIFIKAGFGKIGGWEATAANMAAKGMPLVPLFLALTIAIELGGGLLLAAGYKARWVALLIFLFLIPVTLIFHPFWGIDPAQVRGQMNQFLKNAAIMGGMLMVFAFGPGAYSMDRR